MPEITKKHMKVYKNVKIVAHISQKCVTFALEFTQTM